ncbi:MAG: molybdopterin molybdenumtransferase MoeA [Thermoprotei archaeon]|nr:MAG: molybdopterin molybdenumtransferase MoeA [Thermoprotei archaeon]
MVGRYGFKKLVKVDEAVKRLLSSFSVELPVEEVPLTEAYGRVSAVDLVSPINVPHFNRSAVDGYAVKAEDTFGASPHSPRVLKVVDDPAKVLGSGFAYRISTGYPVPEPFDAVVMLEHSSERNGNLEVYTPLTPMKNVSREGEDVKKGEVIIRRGVIIEPHHVGLAAACGLTSIPVFRKPRALIVSTGEEVLKVGCELYNFKIYDSTSYIIYGLALSEGCKPEIYSKSPISSSREELLEALEYGLRHFDLVLFIGGSSVGSLDIVPRVLEERGIKLFHGVAMKPGMPTAAFNVEGKPVVCLPGFPVAAFFSFITLVSPLIRSMYKLAEDLSTPSFKAKLRRRLAGDLGKRVYVRVRVLRGEDGLEAEPITASGSGVISSLCKAQGYVVLKEDVDFVGEGELVDVYLLGGLMRCLSW